MRNLVLTGGVRHDFESSTGTLVALLADAGIESEWTADIDAGVDRLRSENFDLLTVMALRWRMDGNPKYAALRNEFGFSLAAQSRSIIENFVSQGGGLFGLHTACLCFDDWPQWRDILGGSWIWGQSSHPPYGKVSVSPAGPRHLLTRELPAFELMDEVYGGLDLAPGTIPLLTAHAGDGVEQPVLWAHEFGRGRVVFDALGHDRNSLRQPVHARLVQRCAAWACGCPDEAVQSL